MALRYAEAVTEALARVLGEAIAGAILHGSLTLGDYVPGRSDVDLLAIVEERPTDAQFLALVAAVDHVRKGVPARVDLRLVTREVAAAPSPRPVMEASVEIAVGREPGLCVDARHAEEPDLAVELSMCRSDGRSLVGAAPADLIGAVPTGWLLDIGDGYLAAWQAVGDDPPHAELTVLTSCRIWRLATEGQHSSKSAAGEWALGREPGLDVVRDALQQRHGDPRHPIDAAQVEELLALVRDRVAEARAGA